MGGPVALALLLPPAHSESGVRTALANFLGLQPAFTWVPSDPGDSRPSYFVGLEVHTPAKNSASLERLRFLLGTIQGQKP